jgi:hypothetical protein
LSSAAKLAYSVSEPSVSGWIECVRSPFPARATQPTRLKLIRHAVDDLVMLDSSVREIAAVRYDGEIEAL